MSAEEYGSHDECKHHIPYVLSDDGDYYDSLDEDELRDGDELEVLWADGTWSREKVTVEKRDGSVQVWRAYVTAQRIRLVDAGVKAAFRRYPVTGEYATARDEIEVALSKRVIARMTGAKEPKP